MYSYVKMRDQLFTERGQLMFIRIRDNVNKLLNLSGAVQAEYAIKCATGDSWLMLACLDRMVELGEIIEVPQPGCAGQHRVFIAKM